MGGTGDRDPFAGWNQELEPIEPLIEYYSRQMGQLSGRLMTALSFLTDLENGHDWDNHTVQVRESVHYARLLIASVLQAVAAAQTEQGDVAGAAESIQAVLKRLSEDRNGGEAE